MPTFPVCALRDYGHQAPAPSPTTSATSIPMTDVALLEHTVLEEFNRTAPRARLLDPSKS